MADNNNLALSSFSIVINSQDWGLKKYSDKLIAINGAILSQPKEADGSYPPPAYMPRINLVGEQLVAEIWPKLAAKVVVSIDKGFFSEDKYKKEGQEKNEGKVVITVTKAHVVEKKKENVPTTAAQPAEPVQGASTGMPTTNAAQPAPAPATPAQDVNALLAQMGIS